MINRLIFFIISSLSVFLFCSTIVAKHHRAYGPVSDSNSDSLRLTFPENASYLSHQLTYFKWESQLGEDYQYQLILKKAGVIVLDSLHTPPVSKVVYPDTVVYFEPIPTMNRIDLQDLLEPDQNYQWTIIASNGTDMHQLESTFEVLEATQFSSDAVSLIDSSSFHIDQAYHFIIPVREHGNIADLNLTIDLAKGIEITNSASDERFAVAMFLISPAGTRVKLMDYRYSHPAIHHRRTFDDDAFVSTSQYDHYTLELPTWQGIYNGELSGNPDAQLINQNQRPDLRIQSEEALDQFNGEDSFGNWRLTWFVYDRYARHFRIDPNFIQLDITIEEHPIQLNISAWDHSSVSVDWQTENTYDQFLIEKYADDAISPSSITTIGAFFNHQESFQALDTAYQFRIIGQKGDQQDHSNIIRVKSPLDTPRFASQFELINLFSASSGVSAQPSAIWEKSVETGFVTGAGNSIYEETRTYLGRLRTFHEFDTSAWSSTPNPILQLDSPKKDTVLSISQLKSRGITFQWSGNIKYGGFTLEVYRLNENNTRTPLLTHLGSTATQSSNGQLTFNQQDELIQELSIPGKYRWSVCIGDQTPPTGCLEESSEFYVDHVLAAYVADPIIEIWPNPADQMMFVRNKSGSIHEIKIYSLSGALLLQNSVHRNDVELDIHSLEAGLYLVHILLADKTEIRKLLKQ